MVCSFLLPISLGIPHHPVGVLWFRPQHAKRLFVRLAKAHPA